MLYNVIIWMKSCWKKTFVVDSKEIGYQSSYLPPAYWTTEDSFVTVPMGVGFKRGLSVSTGMSLKASCYVRVCYWLSFFPGTQFFLLVPLPGKAPAPNSMQFGSQISYSIPEIWISLHITLSDIGLSTMTAQEQYIFTCTSYFKWVCSPFCWVCQDIVEMLQFVQTAVFWKKQKTNTEEKLSSHFIYLSYKARRCHFDKHLPLLAEN